MSKKKAEKKLRTQIMDLLKERLEKPEDARWDNAISEITVACANIIEPTTPARKREALEELQKIRNILLDKGFSKEEIEFLNQEIKRHDQSTDISLYDEKEDTVDILTIENYARVGRKQDGILGIPDKLSYEQLKKLTDSIYQRTGIIKFFISSERKIYGKIVAEMFEYAQKIPILTLAGTTKTFEGSQKPISKRIFLFGESMKKGYQKIKEITQKMFVYRFLSDEEEEFILLSVEKRDVGDYVLTGVITECDDKRMLSESSRLPTKLPFFFVKEAKSKIIKFENRTCFVKRLHDLDVTEENFFNIPFCLRKGPAQYVLEHPYWFKRLIWSWLLHKPVGLINPYPCHLWIMGPHHSGKSWLLNTLHSRTKETKKIFSGSSSTLKHLIPSFKSSPAKIGYLAESNRFSFCDEFLRSILRGNAGPGANNRREEAFSLMNDLLEHQKREAGSGVSKVHVSMTARVLATTNPVGQSTNTEELLKNMDSSFMSRWLVYEQTAEHVDMVRNSDDYALKTMNYDISDNDLISVIDYLQSANTDYDPIRFAEIFDDPKQLLSNNLLRHYNARHKHHLSCILDGVIKTRCLMNKEEEFVATEEDYKITKSIWSSIVSSWMNFETLKNVDPIKRLPFLPHNCQTIYGLLRENKGGMNEFDLRQRCRVEMSNRDFINAFGILTDQGLIVNVNDYVKITEVKKRVILSDGKK